MKTYESLKRLGQSTRGDMRRVRRFARVAARMDGRRTSKEFHRYCHHSKKRLSRKP